MDRETANYLDLGAFTVWIAAFFHILPSIAALLSVVWIVLRILELRTSQKLLGRYAWIKRNKEDNDDD